MGKTTKKRNVHAEITAKVIALIEAGTPPWRMPWDGGSLGIHPLRANGERYRGINVLLLWAAASARGFSVPQWMTYRQAQELGGQVTRGAKSEEIVYVGRVERESDQIDPATGEPAKVGIPFMKFYRVFNVAEVEGLPAQFYGTPATRHDWTGHAGADAFFAGIGADVRHGEPRAYYRRDQDFVMMPPRDTFRTGEGYFSTLAHELGHWTGAPHRLNRLKGARFGDANYAREELVAELSACFTMATIGLQLDELDQNAAYLASWLKVLKEDSRAIFKIASHADAATQMLADRASRVDVQEAA